MKFKKSTTQFWNGFKVGSIHLSRYWEMKVKIKICPRCVLEAYDSFGSTIIHLDDTIKAQVVLVEILEGADKGRTSWLSTYWLK